MTDLIGATFGNHQLTEFLGRGGMAEVYKAQHIELDVPRAIKVIRSELVGSEDFRTRFQREAQAVARLDHPNIVSVYDFGVVDGQCYMVMQFVEGADLARMLRRDGPVPESRATALIAEVADALDYAHRLNLIHRDIKPDNIMVDESGRPILMDFGIAKLLTSDTALTGTGMGIGTPAYMAPEQAQGQSVTPATDTYSLCIVLYEMLTGDQPYRAETPIASMMKAINEPLPNLSEILPGISEQTEQIIIRGTQKKPERRYESAADLVRDLTGETVAAPVEEPPELASTVVVKPDRAPIAESRKAQFSVPELAVAGLLLAGLAIFLLVWWLVPSPADAPVAANHDVVRIAVLPFEDFSANGDNAHIAAGLQEDIISRLAEIGELEVTSRSSTRRFSQASERSIPEIARDLAVSHVVEGSIRRSADQVRVSVQLIDANTNSQRWAESYDRELTNIFALQTDVAREVAHQLGKNFSNQTPAQLAQRPTDDLQAYELVLKGRELLAVETTESLAQAAELMAQAVARDPGLAEAHAGLSRALFLQSFYNTSWSEVRTQALQASERALELDPDSASIHTNYAHIRGVWEGDQKTARQHYQKAIELEPNNSFSLLHYGAHLAGSGEVEKGLPFLQRAMTLDPLSGEVGFYLASALLSVGRPEDALNIMERGLKFDPTYLNLRTLEFKSLIYHGDLTAALARLRDLAVLDPHHLQVQGHAVWLLVVIGELDAAQLWVDRMHAMSPTHEDYFYAQRHVYSVTGDIAGLTDLVGRWRTLNSTDRATRSLDSTMSFATWCQLNMLALRADDARRNNDGETEQVLRRSAMDIAQEVLTDEEGKLSIDWDNEKIALSQAVHQRLLGEEQESSALLNAILQSGDDSNDAGHAVRLNAHALLGDHTNSVDYFRSRSNQLNDQTILKTIRDNGFGLYDSMLANPEFVEFLDEAIASNEALQTYVRTELPSLLTATTGL